MRIASYIVAFVLAILLFFLFGFYLSVPQPLSFIIIFMIIFVVLLAPILYVQFSSKNIGQIEAFLKRNQRNPHYRFIYAMAKKDNLEVDAAYQRLLQKYKRPHLQALYHVIYHLFYEDVSAAKDHVESIKKHEYKIYYKAIIAILEKRWDDAITLKDGLQKEWMKNAIMAELERRRGHTEEAFNYAKLALDQSKGVQHYIFKKTYESEFPSLF